MDEHQREMMVLQERFLEHGDLHVDGQRERKFRWRDNDDEEQVWIDHFQNSDDEDTTMFNATFEEVKDVRIVYVEDMKKKTETNDENEAPVEIYPSDVNCSIDTAGGNPNDSSQVTSASVNIVYKKPTLSRPPTLSEPPTLSQQPKLNTNSATTNNNSKPAEKKTKSSAPMNSILHYAIRDRRTVELLSNSVSPGQLVKRPISKLKSIGKKPTAKKLKLGLGVKKDTVTKVSKPVGPNMLDLLSKFE